MKPVQLHGGLYLSVYCLCADAEYDANAIYIMTRINHFVQRAVLTLMKLRFV